VDVRNAFPVAVATGLILGTTIVALQPLQGGESHALENAMAEVMDDIVQWDLPIERNESVLRYVRLFEQRQPDRVALYLKRAGRYEGMIRTKLRDRGMPEDLLYLSMVESGFNTNARSKAQAVGLWQFIADTGRRYGLRIDSYVDERRDPEKATDAALRYLQDLHNMFGSWNLAAAAYNTGEGRVARIMREETGAVRGVEADFWRIRGRLPSETREYVPLMFAMALVGKEPHKYGIDRVERWLPLETERVEVPGGTELAVVARAVGVSEEEIQRLNPHLVRSMTPPGDAYGVVIPTGRAEVYAANFEQARAEAARLAAAKPAPKPAARPAAAKKAPTRTAAARSHQVRKGESLSVIAKRHGTSVTAIQRANGMGKRTNLRVGQVLRLPA
jgi:membrane-bound lytic murein transglycosylase D